MKTLPHMDAEGRTIAFEIENHLILLPGVGRALRGAPGVTDVKMRRSFAFSGDLRGSFSFHGQAYGVIEPFGDSNRYWIGPIAKGEHALDIAPLEFHFRMREDSLLMKLAWIAGWLGLGGLVIEALCTFAGFRLPIAIANWSVGLLITAFSWVAFEFAKEGYHALGRSGVRDKARE